MMFLKKNRGPKLIRPTTEEIRSAVDVAVEGITQNDIDEMAIPSHLHPNPLIRWLMWERYKVIARISRLEKDTKVLEFGCGAGLFLPTLAYNCQEVYAIDLFPQFAKRLTSRRNLAIKYLDDLSSLPEHYLDLVIAADVLEHFDNPSSVLKTMHQKLKPEGKLVISGPTENIAYKIGRIFSGFADKGDYHFTNISQLVKVIDRFRFKKEQIIKLPFIFPPHLFWVAKFEKKNSENEYS